MNFDLYIYGIRSARVELPAITLQNWSFRLHTDVSGFSCDLAIPMVVMLDQWCFASSGDYQIWHGKEAHFERQLMEQDIYRIEVPGEGAVYVQVVPQRYHEPIEKLYLLSAFDSIASHCINLHFCPPDA